MHCGGELDRGKPDRGKLDRGKLDRGEPDREELDRLAPQEMIAGYWRSVSASWNGGTTLADLRPGNE